MNAAQHLVEIYLRFCRNMFTMSDVKVAKGNNRQFDILAFGIKTEDQYHIEVSVTILDRFQPKIEQLEKLFDRKFRGVAPVRKSKRSDHSRGIQYEDQLLKKYEQIGFDPAKIQRVFVMWQPPPKEPLDAFLAEYKNKHNIDIKIWGMRDEILPGLINSIRTANYEDEALRILSIVRQYQKRAKSSQ